MENHLHLSRDSLDSVSRRVTSDPSKLHLDQELCKMLATDLLVPVQRLLAKYAEHMSTEMLNEAFPHQCHMFQELYRVAHRAHILVERCCEEKWWCILFEQACTSHCEEALDIVDDLRWCIAEIGKDSHFPKGPTFKREHFKKPFKECEERDRCVLLNKLEDLVLNLEKLALLRPFAQSDFQLSKFLLARMKVLGVSSISVDQIEASLDYQKFNMKGKNGRPLGKGSAGSVFTTDFLSIQCARKEQEACSDVQLQEFAKQAVKLSKLSHPYVIKLFGFCSKKRLDEAHKGFFLMELMSGSLYKEMKKGGKKQLFQLQVAVDIMIQMAKGVRYLHENGVSHRDLKCDNILVTRLLIPSKLVNTSYEEYQHIKVTDFDQAKFFTGNSSDCQLQSRPNVGSTPWRAPECNTESGKGSVVKVNSKRADTYSFAMTCYELISEEDSPFDALQEDGMVKKKILAIQAGKRPPIPKACPQLLERLITDCWRNEAPQRPDFDEIHRRLQDVQSVLLTGTLSQRNRQCDGASASLQKRGVRTMVYTMFKHIKLNAANATHRLWKTVLPQMHSGITEVVPPSNKDGSNKEHDALSVTKVIVGLDFGTTHSGVAYATASNPDDIHTISWPSVGEEVYNCKTLTAIFRATPNGDSAWGYPARKEYASRYGREDTHNIHYFRELKQSLSSMDSGSNEPVVEYLRKLGSFVLDYLQHFAECFEKESLRMDHLRWCITVPSDWSSNSKELQSFGACLEMAGLVQGQAFDVFRESDAAARHCYMNCFSSAHLEKGDGICVLDIGSGNLQCVFEDWHDVERTENAYGVALTAAESMMKERFFRVICEKVGQVPDSVPSVYAPLLDADLEYLKANPDHSISIPWWKSNPADSNDTGIHLEINSSEWGVILKPLVDEVVFFLQEQLRKNSFVNLKRLFIVGGYGKFGHLIKEIKRSFPAIIIDKSLRNPGSAICKGAVALGLTLLQARTQHSGSSSNSGGGGEEANLDGGTRGTNSDQHGQPGSSQPGSSQPGSSQKLNPSTSTYSSAADSKGKKKANAKDELEDFLPQKMLVALDFGTSQMSFAYSHASNPSKITVCEGHQRRTMDFYYEIQGNTLCLRSSGQQAKVDCGANIPGEYVSKPKLHLLVDDHDPELELSLPTGLTIDDVISESLREYGEFILQVLQEKFGESFELQHIQWCLLVPSFWRENVKRGMRDCMVNAGLLRGARNVDASPYPLVTVLEAEAASVACIRSLNLGKGMKFMVANIGGGALDMVIHEMIGESDELCNMRELSISAGGFYGSSCLDLNFLTFLSMRMGAWINNYLERNPCVMNNLLSQWEQIKVEFFDDCDPSTLVFPRTLQDAWRHSISMSGLLDEPLESLQLTFEDVKMIFEPVVRTILERMEAQLGQTSNVDALVVVGEFAKSPYLFGHIKHKFCDQVKTMIRLGDSKSVVLKGAILFGMQPKIIRSRVAKRTYGLGMSLDFQVGLCSTEEKSNEVERFRIDVEKGSRVEVDSCVTSVHKLHSHAQKTMKFTLYSSVESYPRYTEEESVTKEWDFMVDTSDCVTSEEKPQIEIILYYGRSAIEIEAKGVNFKSGSLLSVTFVTEAMSQRNVVAPSVARRTYGIGVMNSREEWDLLKYMKHVDGEDLCDFCFEPYIQKGTQLDYTASRTLFPIHNKQQYLPFTLYSSLETSPVYVTDDAVVEEGTLEIDMRKGLIVDKDREVSVRMSFGRTDIKIRAVALNFAHPEDRNLPIRLREGKWESQVTLNLTQHLRVVPLQSGALCKLQPDSSITSGKMNEDCCIIDVHEDQLELEKRLNDGNMAESPSPAEVDYLGLCGNTVCSLEDVIASGAHLLNLRQCKDLSSKLSKATGNIRELVLYCETSMTRFRPGLEILHRCLEKAEALVRSCAEEDWCGAAVLQIEKESAFRNILEDVNSCYKAIYEVAKSAVLDWNGGPEDLQQSSVFEFARDGDVHEDQLELEKRLNDSAQVELLNLCRKILLSVRNVVKSDKVLLNRRQCVDLSSKLCITALNVFQLVSCGGASILPFHLALNKLCQVLERAKAVVSSCADDDWLAAAVFQIDNENSFRMILLDVSLCYNALYEIAKSTSKLWNNPPEDLRLPSLLVFMPTQSSDVDEDKGDLQKMLDDLANGYTKFKAMDHLVPGRISRAQSLAKYLLVKVCSTPSDPQVAHLDIYSTLLWRKVSEPMRTWGSARFLGSGSGGSGVVSTTWLGIPCAKKVFHGQDYEGFFLKEAGILVHLKHPCVANFVCCGNGLEKGDRFIAMELMEKSLADLIEEQKGAHFSLHVVVDMMVQIAHGVCYLHGRGVAHRDLKPQNVVVSKLSSLDGESHYCVKLVDFGMSKTKVEASKVNTMSVFGIGTTRYRAPELGRQAHPHGSGRASWFKADVYSFAMTCAHLLTLKTPFGEVTVLWELDTKLMNGARPSLPRDCPKELVALLEDCWNTSAESRPIFGEVCTRLEKFKYALLRGFVGGIGSGEGNVFGYDFIKRMVEEQSSHQVMLVDTTDDDKEDMLDAESDPPSAREMKRGRENDGENWAGSSGKNNAACSKRKRVDHVSVDILDKLDLESESASIDGDDFRQWNMVSSQMHSGITEVEPPSKKDGSNKEHDKFRVTKVIVGLDFGTTHSGVAYAAASNPQHIHTISWPLALEEVYNCKTLTAISRSTPNGDWIWGYPARKEYASRYGREDTHNIHYFRELKQSLSSMDSGSNELQPVVGYLQKLGSFVLDYLQHYEECFEKESLRMDHLRWCITVPSDWSSNSKELQSFGACLEMAGLVQGQAFDVFRESDAAARHCYMNCFSSAHLEKGDGICVLDIGSGNLQCVFEDWHDVERTENAYGVALTAAESMMKERFFRVICEKVGQVPDSVPSVYAPLLDADLEYLKANPDHSISIPWWKSNPADSNDTGIHLEINSSEWGVILKPLVDEVVFFLQEQLRKNSFVNLKRLFIVGGYGKFGHLIKEIKRSFPAIIIDKSLRNPGSAICKGAVALGLTLLQARTQHSGSSSNSGGGGEEANLDGGTRGFADSAISSEGSGCGLGHQTYDTAWSLANAASSVVSVTGPQPGYGNVLQKLHAESPVPVSRFSGVRWKARKWTAEIRPTGTKKTVWLGTYATEEEAASAYDAGVFYFDKPKYYNFDDSERMLPTLNRSLDERSQLHFIKTQARIIAKRRAAIMDQASMPWTSLTPRPYRS